jgi:hypothetical protein
MPSITERRSPRQALELPIRVFGVDYQGTHFVEDSTTLVVSRHGAKIRLTRKLIPEMEILILCQDSMHEGLFRVVGQAGEPTGKFFFWGVECLEPAENIYETGVAMPASEPSPIPDPLPSPELAPRPVPQIDPNLSSNDEFYVQAWLRCSKCGMREPVQLDETQIQAMRKAKGLVRSCPLCGPTTVWRLVGIVGS